MLAHNDDLRIRQFSPQCRATSKPPIPGLLMSRRMRSGCSCCAFFSASVPSGASPQTCHFGSDDKSAATPETYPLVIIGNENTQERQPAVPATLLSGNARRLVLK